MLCYIYATLGCFAMLCYAIFNVRSKLRVEVLEYSADR